MKALRKPQAIVLLMLVAALVFTVSIGILSYASTLLPEDDRKYRQRPIAASRLRREPALELDQHPGEGVRRARAGNAKVEREWRPVDDDGARATASESEGAADGVRHLNEEQGRPAERRSRTTRIMRGGAGADATAPARARKGRTAGLAKRRGDLPTTSFSAILGSKKVVAWRSSSGTGLLDREYHGTLRHRVVKEAIAPTLDVLKTLKRSASQILDPVRPATDQVVDMLQTGEPPKAAAPDSAGAGAGGGLFDDAQDVQEERPDFMEGRQFQELREQLDSLRTSNCSCVIFTPKAGIEDALFPLATAYPTCTFLQVSISSAIRKAGDSLPMTRKERISTPLNMHVASVAPGLGAFDEAVGVGRFGVGVLMDLAALGEDYLPNEFEQTLGRLLQLSTSTLLPDELPRTRYFSFWTDAMQLLRAAALRARLRLHRIKQIAGGYSPETSYVIAQPKERDGGLGSGDADEDLDLSLVDDEDRQRVQRLRNHDRSAITFTFLNKLGLTRFSRHRVLQMAVACDVELAFEDLFLGGDVAAAEPIPFQPLPDESEEDLEGRRSRPVESSAGGAAVATSSDQDGADGSGDLGGAPTGGGAGHGLVFSYERKVRAEGGRLEDFWGDAGGLAQEQAKHLFAVQSDSLAAWWALLKDALGDIHDGTGHVSWGVWGSDLSLLGVKLAQQFPMDMVASFGESGGHLLAQRKLAELHELKNYLFGAAPFHIARVAAIQAPLVAGPSFFGDKGGAGAATSLRHVDIAVVSEVFITSLFEHVESQARHGREICELGSLETLIGEVISFGAVSVVRMPSVARLLRLLSLISPHCGDALLSAHYNIEDPAEVAALRLLSNSLRRAALPSAAGDLEILRVGCNVHDRCTFVVRPTGAYAGGSKEIRASPPARGVSLHAMLHMGLSDTSRAALLRAVLTYAMPRTSVSPWATRFFGGREGPIVVYNEALLAGDDALAVEAENIAKAIEESGDMKESRQHFSMLFHGARFAPTFARRFGDASVLAISSTQPTELPAEAVEGEEGDPPNLQRCVDDDPVALLKHLYESPELFRYQVLEIPLLQAARLFQGETLGELLSCAMTTFVNLAPDWQVSAALELLFPLGGTEEADSLPSGGAFEETALSDHPKERLKGFGERLLQNQVRVPDGYTKVDAKRLQADARFVRLDVVDMERHVHHHFDYQREAHARTYTMRVLAGAGADFGANPNFGSHARDGQHVSNGRVVDVKLIREQDAHVIPYKEVWGFTLIAALRMGLTRKCRERAYTEFVKLPLYEDMAPWNIIFAGSSLKYIDNDTQGHTYDLQVPRAYQILSVLMNYKRTVEDFKRCGYKAKTEFGFAWVSECVGSTFNGPCPDVEKPVPCADGKCHSDYISCLKSLEIEQRGKVFTHEELHRASEKSFNLRFQDA